MGNEKLYVIYGTGNDAVGHVGKITRPIAELKCNIVDLRQDVMHGLFIINMVVDISKADIRFDGLQKTITSISNETNINLSIEKYNPVPRDPNKKNFLFIMLGYDKPGIISAITRTLSDYNINIELSNMVAREGIFLMELLTDIQHCTLPTSNVKKTLSEKMKTIDINTMFQEKDVFNKKKRIIVFDISGSFIDNLIIDEIVNQANIKKEDIQSLYACDDVQKSLSNAASRIDNLPVEVVNSIVETIEIRSTTLELIETLKIMGYRIIITTNAFSFFTKYLKKSLSIDYAFGCDIIINDDLKTVTGELKKEFFSDNHKEKIITLVKSKEEVLDDDITIIRDNDLAPGLPGIGVDFNMKEILNYYNQHILSDDALTGILGSFGIPKL